MLNQSLVGRMCEWRMITPSLQGDAVNGIIANLVNGRAVMMEDGIMLCKDYIITLPGFSLSIIGTLWIETLLSAMIFFNQHPLVIFGKSLFVKENDNALKDCCFFFCDLLLKLAACSERPLKAYNNYL